jgi:hypothetical protein
MHPPGVAHADLDAAHAKSDSIRARVYLCGTVKVSDAQKLS